MLVKDLSLNLKMYAFVDDGSLNDLWDVFGKLPARENLLDIVARQDATTKKEVQRMHVLNSRILKCYRNLAHKLAFPRLRFSRVAAPAVGSLIWCLRLETSNLRLGCCDVDSGNRRVPRPWTSISYRSLQ